MVKNEYQIFKMISVQVDKVCKVKAVEISPSRIWTVIYADVWCSINFPTLYAFYVVYRFLPDCKITLLDHLLPAKSLCDILDFILFLS